MAKTCAVLKKSNVRVLLVDDDVTDDKNHYGRTADWVHVLKLRDVVKDFERFLMDDDYTGTHVVKEFRKRFKGVM